MQYILISGKRCSGKDTSAVLIKKLLCEQGFNVCISSLADQVKYRFAKKFGLDYEKLINDYKYKSIHRKEIISFAQSEKKKDINVWVKLLLKRINEKNNDTEINYVIIPDNRFQHEIQYFEKMHKNQHILFRITSQDKSKFQRGWSFNKDIDCHLSEVDLDNWIKFDYTVPNDSLIADLRENLLQPLQKII